MRTQDVFPSRFLKAGDIGDGERVFTIAGVAIEEVGDDQKPVARFEGEKKGLVLNRTNWDRIGYIAGNDESTEWVGLKVALYTELVSFGGKSAPAIRIRNTRVPKPATMSAAAASSKKAASEIPPWVDDPEDPGVAA
jgi:hypothetical protein